MRNFIFFIFLLALCSEVKSQSNDTIIAIVPRHFKYSYFEKKISPDDFFISKDTLYYKSYQKSKLKKLDSVIYYSNYILYRPIIFKKRNGQKVFIGYWNYESIYGKYRYYNKKGFCIIQGETNR